MKKKKNQICLKSISFSGTGARAIKPGEKSKKKETVKEYIKRINKK